MLQFAGTILAALASILCFEEAIFTLSINWQLNELTDLKE
jgi:hypothetical protein